MSRARQIIAGAVALTLLLGLLAGVPYMLVAYVGWPLPHGVPSWSQFTTALGTRGIPDSTLLKALALAVWLAWASLTTAVLAEVVAVVRGNTSPHLPLAGLLQPLAGHLLAAILVGALALARPVPSPRLVLPSANAAMGSTPVAALLVADITPSTARTNGTTPTSVPATTTYVVRSDDTLWAIAAARLGDAERWKEIFELNRGRPQADGRPLTNPHWIYPGWVLLLPTTAHQAAPREPASPDSSHASPAPSASQTTVPSSPTPAPTRADGPMGNGVAADSSHTSAHVGPRGPQREPVGQMPQRLPSGSLVGASFVAGVLALLALGRLRRRHSYRYRSPGPGRDLGHTPLGPTLQALRQQSNLGEPEDEEVASTEDSLVIPAPAPEADTHLLEVGVRGDRPIQLDRHQLSLLSLDGAGAEDVARYMLNALLVERGRGDVEFLAERSVLDALAPGAAELLAVRVAESPEVVVRALETELLARSRRLADSDLPDIDTYRRSHPEDPVPTLAAVMATPDRALGARLAELAKSGPRLDLMIVVLDETELGSHLSISADRRVVAVSSESLAGDADGAECYALGTDEASEIASALAAAEPNEEPEDVSIVAEPTEEPERYDEPWPEVAATESPHSVEVRMLGAYRLFAHGKEITRGRRRAAKELLAWYALRPEGATAEAAVDAIWPETEPDHVSKRFWLALGDLRTLCRDPSGESHVEVLVKRGERYAIDAEAVSIDVWEFQARLSDTAKASDPEQQRLALRSAVDAYRGDFAEDEDYLWIEPAREDLHRRALDAHLRLAELEEELDAPDRGIEVLERTIALDRYAEEPYRRAMRLLARLERFDSVDAMWHSLQAALSDLNIEPDRETLALYRTLSSTRERAQAASS